MITARLLLNQHTTVISRLTKELISKYSSTLHWNHGNRRLNKFPRPAEKKKKKENKEKWNVLRVSHTIYYLQLNRDVVVPVDTTKCVRLHCSLQTWRILSNLTWMDIEPHSTVSWMTDSLPERSYKCIASITISCFRQFRRLKQIL